MRQDNTEFQAILAQLVETLQEELRQNHRFLRVLRRKKETLLREAHHELDSILRIEKEVLTDLVTVERDRIQLLTQVGEVLGHAQPTRLRIAEIVLHADPENRDELLDIREELRDVADELEDLNSVEPLFSKHRQDNVRLYVSPKRWEHSAGGHDDASLPRSTDPAAIPEH